MAATFPSLRTSVRACSRGRHVCFGLLAGLVAACSYDASRLRAPNRALLDAGLDRSADRDAVLSDDDATDGPGPEGRDEGGPGDDSDARDAPVDVSVDAMDLPRADEPAASEAPVDRPDLDVALDGIVFDGPDGAGSDGVGAGGSGSGGRGGSGGAGGTGASGGTTGSGGVGGGPGGTRGTGGATGAGGTGVDPDLVVWYRFDESSGTTAADSSLAGAGTRDGTLGTVGGSGSAMFTNDAQVGAHALSLVPSNSSPSSAGGYVTVPSPTSLAPEALTIAVWVKLAAASPNQDWERIFDFGNGTGSNAPYVYLTARDANTAGTPVRFGLSDVGHAVSGLETIVGTTALPANEWHHLAVVLPPGPSYTGTLYIDGAVAGTNTAMTLHLSDVGPTTQNWIGRSPFTGDPFFYGALDDFRVYRRALSAAEISALLAQQ
jgi:hypothetical protein